MRKTITIKDESIEIMRDGYNIIEQTIYGDNIPEVLIQSLTYARDNLDMDNMGAMDVLGYLIEALEKAK